MPGKLTNRQKTLVVDACRTNFPLPMLLKTIDLSVSSFYYQQQALSRPDQFGAIRRHIHAAAKKGRYTYGYRRIWWELRNHGVIISEKVVRRLMDEEQIEVRMPKQKRRYSSYQGELTPAPPNLVKQNFHAENPGELWLTDITECAARNGKVYLSAIIDCFDGLVVGWRTGKHPTLDVAEDSLKDAIEAFPQGTGQRRIVHSDRGVHYRANDWITTTQQAGITRSMSKKGCSPDNAACEGFFGRLKNEMFYHRSWPDVDELEAEINDYIEFYNDVRIKDSLGGMSISDYRSLIAC